MKRSLSLVLLSFITFLVYPAVAHAQAWSGIIDANRGTDWTGVGIAGGIPSGSWTQCGSTIAAGSSAATITAALTSCAGQSKYVLLGPGTFNIGGITFNNGGHVALRGSGPSTILNFSAAASGCNGRSAFICNVGGDGTSRGQPQNQQTVHNWTANFAKGTTQIKLDSVSGIVAGKSMVLLNQCDTGFNGPTCSTGTATDNGGYFECSMPWSSLGVGCTPTGEGSDGASWRGTASNANPAWQQEWALVTNIVGTVVTLSKGLDHPNWALAQGPQAVVIQPVIQIGVENLTIVGPGTSLVDGIYYLNCYQCWVTGVAVKNDGNKGVEVLDGVNTVIQNNYFFGNPQSYGDNAGIGLQGGNNLVQNNICQQRSMCIMTDGPDEGSVFAYNYAPAGFISSSFPGMKYSYDSHSAGDNFELFEGNVFGSMLDDDDHGTHLNQTRFRNFLHGWQSCANAQCTTVNTFVWALGEVAGDRYSANIANVLGTPGYHTIYQDGAEFGSGEIYSLGGGNGSLPLDPLARSTSMYWGNYDTVTGATRWCGNSSDTGWSTTCGSTSEVPTGAPTYPNAMPSKGDTGIGQGALPASFYLASKPGWFGSIPWPAIGPDVSSGNVAQCTGTLNTIKQAGLPATSGTQCTGTGATTTAWGGHVNAIPAMACYLTTMGGTPDGSGSALAFDANKCYGGSSSSQGPSSPTNLSAIVQ